MAFVGAALVWLASACGPAARPPSPAADSTADPEPDLARAEFYGGPGPEAPPTVEEESLWSSVVGTNPSCRCVLDPRLILAARYHAAALVSSGKPPADSDVDHLRFALLALGGTDYGTDYAQQPLLTALDDRGRASLRSFVLAHGDRWTHCGVGIAGPPGGEVVVWIGVERAVELGPVPVRSASGVELEVEGRTLTDRPIAVQPFLGLPDGSVRPLATTSGWSGVNGGRFTVSIPLPSAGRYDLELLVDQGRGPEISVLLPLYVDVSPDPGPVITLDAPAGDDDRPPIEALAELVNRARTGAGLAPLARDPRLDRIAGQHCRRMVELGFFGHRSPDGGLLGDRLRAAGLAPAKSAENIARSRSVPRVHHNLMKSPSHRLNIVDPEFTHLGLGLARDGDDAVVTEIYARW